MGKRTLMAIMGTRSTMRSFCAIAAAAWLIAAAPPSGESVAPGPAPTYADLADLGLAAPVAAHVRIARAVAVKGAQAAGVRPGHARFYVEGDLVSLIRGAQGLPARVAWVVDLPLDSKGKPPKLRKKSEYILLASAVPGRPGELRLVAPDAQIGWTVQRAETLRAIFREASAADAAPRITGIGRAFHAPGSIPGESETQIFLQTQSGRPVSLNVLRRPGQTPHWSVSLSEIVDDAAAAPRPNSLLWYRLACTLPASLPGQSLAESSAEEAQAIRADYRLVLQGLGPCARIRTRG